jgi:hypothetical protein
MRRPQLRMAVAGMLVGALAVGLRAATLYVDDDTSNDPCPGDPSASYSVEDGSSQHPFDAIQEAVV